MYNCSQELTKFYNKKVVLSRDSQNDLREKRKKNIKRLKNGLKKYNDDNNTSYKIAENKVQGSMAMHTVVQNDDREYDIDVGIVFDDDNLNNLGPLATRNMVAEALNTEMNQFNSKAEVKTSCIRINYEAGYHVDFAVYKRNKILLSDNEYIYEHAGNKWVERDLKALNNWFEEEMKSKGDILRKIIRLSKMFCKSRDKWKNMPSGLIQTVLCARMIVTKYERLDETFYYTMKNIIEELNKNDEIIAPVDNGRNLTKRKIDKERIKNWRERLESQLNDFEILFNPNCTMEVAQKVWGNFFNHSYWDNLNKNSTSDDIETKDYNDTEEFIGDLYPVIEKYDLNIKCEVQGNGFRKMLLSKFIGLGNTNNFIPYNFKVHCEVYDTNCSDYDKILWKVKNVGEVAERKNCIRGEIVEGRGVKITEHTSFKGTHYIECYLIKDGICVAIDYVDVPIGE
ncbi:nucleotide-binding domain-containing protein [Dolosigranulum pigrum]|uniref:nucleotide-binding domain-containing protein n=1 Tax=Dolosigranulum pigrum TaxID=29394 RepID=UPI000DBF4E48|nr:nucleotidyltransferase [Dolosigranulum pigrum]QTJ49889.1 nucleotidyltransferase [Dolosigranulum pigrum]RAN64605.1 nucleotidyltransferase [Dolosigranulum pigrum]